MQIRTRSRTVFAGLVGIVLVPPPSHAADGVIEISQTRALVGGITATDAPGFPVTLDTSESYALTSDLIVSGVDTSAVVLTASDVTLDLRGFTIQGGCPIAGCALGAGSGIGIDALVGTGYQLRNGRVRGFGNDGVLVGARSRVSGLVVERNGRDGLSASGQIDITDTTTLQNARYGINAGAQAKVNRSTADSNGQGGIVTAGYSIVRESSTRSNLTGGGGLGSGIWTGIGCLVQGNAASSNQRYGIDVEGRGGLVLDNIVSANTATGILLVQPGSVQGNTSNGNLAFGLAMPVAAGSRAGYRANVVNGNAINTVSGGIDLGGNSCNGTTSCP